MSQSTHTPTFLAFAFAGTSVGLMFAVAHVSDAYRPMRALPASPMQVEVAEAASAPAQAVAVAEVALPVPEEKPVMPMALGASLTVDTATTREAQRFQHRAASALGVALTPAEAQRLITARQQLMSQSVTVRFVLEGPLAPDTPPTDWVLAVSEHPSWVHSLVNGRDMRFVLHEEQILADVEQKLTQDLPAPAPAIVESIMTDDYGNRRATIDGTAQPGYEFDRQAAARDIVAAFTKGTPTVDVSLAYDSGTVVLAEPAGKHQQLHLLAAGHSDFANSPWGRDFNVRKVLSEQLNGVVVAPDATFSFNGIIKGSSGWKEALGIFEGGELRPVPGGGICQGATTLYRAIAKAGLPVVDRANHSLYVTYYKAHGVGIDATVFPGAQDLSFVNDTGHDIVIRARHDGTEAWVELYGVSDGREVELEGPYFAQTAPADLTIDGRPIKNNEILWLQRIKHNDGATEIKQIVSRYRSIPSSLSKEYPTPTGEY